jgi:transposase
MQLQLYGKKIFLYRTPVDFRASIDGLSYLVVGEIKQSPKEGIYLFYNRNRDKIKCLSWHKNGFIMVYKRLEQGRFNLIFNKTEGVIEMSYQDLSWMLAGLEWQKMREWKELNYDKFS